MLATFTIKRRFNGLALSLYVDCERREAALTVSHNRRLVRVGEAVRFHDVQSPDAAERYLSRPMGERGNLTEWLEWQCRSGMLAPAGEG